MRQQPADPASSLAPLPEESIRLMLAFLASFPSGNRYLVGVSGGSDSVALLHILKILGYKNLIVCHLNHGLRGRQGLADARFVGKLATSLDYLCEQEKADIRKIAKENKQSIEAAARECRYAFFARVGTRHRSRRIFIAHHANDRVETFLFNLFRGTGPAGLSTLAMDSHRPIDGRMTRILRPLIGLWRDDLRAWLAARGIRYREDTSNTDLAFSRNRMRHQILPLLEENFGRRIQPTVWRTAEILQSENTLLKTIAAEHLPEETLRHATLKKLPLALQRRVLFSWLHQHGITDVGFNEVERVRSLLDIAAGGPAKVNLPGGKFARRRSGILFIE